MLEKDRVPAELLVQEGCMWEGSFDLLTRSSVGSNQTTVIATFTDQTRALRAGEKIAEAFGSKFLGFVVRS